MPIILLPQPSKRNFQVIILAQVFLKSDTQNFALIYDMQKVSSLESTAPATDVFEDVWLRYNYSMNKNSPLRLSKVKKQKAWIKKMKRDF